MAADVTVTGSFFMIDAADKSGLAARSGSPFNMANLRESGGTGFLQALTGASGAAGATGAAGGATGAGESQPGAAESAGALQRKTDVQAQQKAEKDADTSLLYPAEFPADADEVTQANWSRSIPVDAIFRIDGEIVGSLDDTCEFRSRRGELVWPEALADLSLSPAERIACVKEANPGVEVLDFSDWENRPTKGQVQDSIWGKDPRYIEDEKARDPDWTPDVLFDEQGNLLIEKAEDGEEDITGQFAAAAEARLSRMDTGNLDTMRALQEMV